MALAAQGKLPQAIQQYEQALQFLPDYGEAYNNLGIALAAQGKLLEAIQHYERAIQLKRDFAEAHNNLGNALDNQGKPSEAIEHYERAIQLKPDYAEAYYNAGLVLTRQGKLPEAIQRYERVIQLKPDYVAALNNLAYVLATSQNVLLRNGVRAIALSEQANQLTDGRNPVVLATLAAAYAEAGRFPEAVETASRGIELASAQGNSALASVLQSRLELYKANIRLPDRR
jgi:tetratricopeptide (TPR) repeat protein